MIFYIVTSHVIGFGFFALGADIGITILAALVGTPILLIALGVARYNKWL